MTSTQIRLRMYNLEEISDHVRKWESGIQNHLEVLIGEKGLEPVNPIELTQTCGWPLISSQRSLYRVVAVPM